MFFYDKIKINDIIFVNHLVGNPKGSYTEFKTNTIYHYQLLYKLSGEAIITFDNKKITENAGDLRFLPNPSLFDYQPLYAAHVLEQGESINIGFTSSSPLPEEILVKHFDNSDVFKHLFHKIQKYWYFKHDGYYYKCMSVLYDIFAEIFKADAKYLSPDTQNQIQPAINYIDNHFTMPKIDCEYLAELCNISHTYMTKLFNKCFGMPPNKYITTKKLQYACDLLNTGHYTMIEIAEKAGFSNEYYFSRIFKKHIGCCPSVYTKTIPHNTKFTI